MPAALALADALICDLVYGLRYAVGCAFVFFLFAKLDDQPRDKQKDPQAKINHPPPATDKNPPEAAAPFFFVF